MRVNFNIEKQLNSDGCIQACFISILNYFNFNKPKYTERSLLNLMSIQQQKRINSKTKVLSGFDCLKVVVDCFLHPGYEIVINDFNESPEFMRKYIKKDIPVMQIIKSVKNAHCIVITDSDRENLHVHDPATGCAKWITDEDFNILRGNHGHQMVVLPKKYK